MAVIVVDERVQATAGDERWLLPRRQAWLAFAMAFLLMTFDFIDRQIVVSMFPALKAEWGLSERSSARWCP